MPRTPPEPLSFDARDLPPDAIEERFRSAREAGRPGYLWPDVPVEGWRGALDAIERAAAALLADEDAAVRLEPAGFDARALGVAGYTSGLGPLLGRWIEAGRIETEPDAGALLLLHLAHARARAGRLERALRRTLDVLADAGIRATVLKSAHTARAYFPEPAVRPAADLDLAVSADRFADASRALARAGYALAQRQPRPRQATWVPPGAPTTLRSLELVHADDPYTVDLHASLDRSFFGVRTVRLGAVVDDDATRPWPALHPAARVLAQPLLTAYLAVHASEGLHNLTLLRLVELVRVIRTDTASGALRPDALAELLERARALRFAHPALELAERLAPGTIDPDLRSTLARAATPRMTRVLAGLRPAAAQRLERLSLDERFMWSAGPVEHLRRLAYMAWPSWIGASLPRIRRIYAERVYRLLRRRVAWRGTGGGRPDDDPDGA